MNIIVHVELVGEADGQYPEAGRVKSLVEHYLSGLSGSDGTRVNVTLDARSRAPGDPPTAGYHQITIVADPGLAPHTGRGEPNAATSPSTGCWPLQYGPFDSGQAYAHEVMHLAGLPDANSPVVVANGHRYTATGVETGDFNGLRSWVDAHGISPNPLANYRDYWDALPRGGDLPTGVSRSRERPDGRRGRHARREAVQERPGPPDSPRRGSFAREPGRHSLQQER